MNSAVSRALIYSPPSKPKWLHLWIPLRGPIYFVSRFILFFLLICNCEYVKKKPSSAIKSESGRTGARNWKGLHPDSYESKCQRKINPWYKAKNCTLFKKPFNHVCMRTGIWRSYFSFKSPKTRETSLQPFKFAFLFVIMHFHDAHLSEAIHLNP